nr:hypothetical protein [uncultured Arsenicibacter sp.]
MKKHLLHFISLSLLFSACQEAKPDCGCDGSGGTVLTDRLAVYTNTQIRTLGTGGYFFTVCNNDKLKEKNIQAGDTVYVSGVTNNSCYKGETLIALPGYIKLTELRKK